jgi:hypothetical protein
MATEPVTDQGPAMSQGSSASGFDQARLQDPTTPGAALDCTAVDQDDDVTMVIARGGPRFGRSHERFLRGALTIVGLAAVGFIATGIAKRAMVHHRSSRQSLTAPSAPAAATAKPATDPAPSSPVLAPLAQPPKLATAQPPSVASLAARSTEGAVAAPPLAGSQAVKDTPQVPVGDAPSNCRAALAKRNTAAIALACDHALEVDASLAVPILAWAKRELDRGNVAVATAWARRTLDTDQSLADAYLIVGVAEQEAKHATAAKAAYRRYLELAPRGRYVRDVRLSMAEL